jgi:hypothetical protein
MRQANKNHSEYFKKALICGMFNLSRYRNHTDMLDYYNYFEKNYENKYYREKESLKPNTMVYCNHCAVGCRFFNMEKHCAKTSHRRITECD